MRPFDALEIAEYIIERCNEKHKSVSNLKLQKILYFVQAQFIDSIKETTPLQGRFCYDIDADKDLCVSKNFLHANALSLLKFNHICVIIILMKGTDGNG